jgi:hypothetical protein
MASTSNYLGRADRCPQTYIAYSLRTHLSVASIHITCTPHPSSMLTALRRLTTHATQSTRRTLSSTSRLNMKVSPVQVSWSDNWMYIIADDASNEGFVVDPYDPKSIIEEVKKADVKVGLL